MKTSIIVLGIGLLMVAAAVRLILGTESTTVFGILFLLGGSALSILGMVQVIISTVQAIRRRKFTAPTVTTQAVIDIEDTTATGNGSIANTGGENCKEETC